jgi:hypothetical protein
MCRWSWLVSSLAFQIRKEFVLGQLLAGELERIEGHPRAPL